MDNNDNSAAAAPVLPIPPRPMAAVEHPALLTSLARGIDSFGGRADYGQIVAPSGPQASVPVFLRHEDPCSGVLSSHNAAAHNVVLAVHVPKRTGMKRKRGTGEPWQYDPAVVAAAEYSGYSRDGRRAPPPGDTLYQRDARLLRRRLRDTAGQYQTEVVGLVKHSHRYRGLSDFQQSTYDSAFMTKFTESILPGELSKLRNFSLSPGVAAPPDVDLPPPPFFTTQALPFPYFYTQNPFVREVVSTHDGAVRLVNSTAGATVAGYLLGFDEEPVPTAPPPALPPITGSRRRVAILEAMRRAVDERPVWTRRGLVNHMRAAMGLPFTENRLKLYFAHVCYQFKGGAWRDTLVRYGVDPRQDPACRQYQTLMFKLHRHADRTGACWHSVVEEREGKEEGVEGGEARGKHVVTPLATAAAAGGGADNNVVRQDTHIFDGRSYCDDGKIWQVCDLHDPLLAALLADAPQRPTCERVSSGWYHQGTWAKARAVMKTKLLAIRFGRVVDDAHYDGALAVAHETPRLSVRTVKVPVPDLQLTAEESAVIASRVYHGRPKKRARKRGATSVSVPILSTQRGAAAAVAKMTRPDGERGGQVGVDEEETGGRQEKRGEEVEEDGEDDEDVEDIEDEGVDDEEGEEEEEDEAEEDEEEDDDEAVDRIAIKEEILDDMERGGAGR